jgi:hypothetical protein
LHGIEEIRISGPIAEELKDKEQLLVTSSIRKSFCGLVMGFYGRVKN